MTGFNLDRIDQSGLTPDELLRVQQLGALADSAADEALAIVSGAVENKTITVTESDPVVGAISGIVKSDGAGTISAATSGTDYSAGTSALATGILKSTTTTGSLSIATDGTDYLSPTTGLKLDQTTPQTITGSAPIFGEGLKTDTISEETTDAGVTIDGVLLKDSGVSGATGAFTAASSLTLGTASTAAGAILFKNATNANTLTLQSGVTAAATTYTLPLNYPAASGYALVSTDAGVMSWAAAGGFSWNATAAGTSGTGLALTVSDSASASTIGQSITIGNTQTNAVTGLSINAGTSAQAHVGIKINSTDTAYRSGILINSYSSATQANAAEYSLIIGRNFNTSSSFAYSGLIIYNQNNSSTGVNTGLTVYSYAADMVTTDTTAAYGTGCGARFLQADNSASAISGFVDPNASNTSNGWMNAKLSNSMSGANTLIKLDLGTSAQGHTGLLINMPNASTGCRALKIDGSTTCTGRGISIVGGGSSFYGISWDTYVNNNVTTAYGLYQQVVLSVSNTGVKTGYGIYQGTVGSFGNTSGTCLAYGIYQGNVAGANGFGNAYGLYQETVGSYGSNVNGYGIYQKNISGGSSGLAYGIYQENISGTTNGTGGNNPVAWYVKQLENTTYVGTGVGAKFFSLNNSTSGSLTNPRTTNASDCLFSRTNTATSGTIADDFNLFYFKRTSVQNGTGGTFTAAGSVLSLENVATQTAGTLTDSVHLLKLTQDADSTGYPIYITQNAVVSTNYRKIFTESNTGITFWMGNGTTANGNLSGTAGDILINGGSNKPEYCTGTNVWVALV